MAIIQVFLLGVLAVETVVSQLPVANLQAPRRYSGLPVDSSQCGIYSESFIPDEDILNSVHARPNEFPWQVQIEDIFGERVCSAVVLDDQWLLSTASCTDNFPWHGISPYAILERAYYKPIDAQPYRRTIPISRVLKHPQYEAAGFLNDFALIKMTEKIHLSEWSLQRACLPNPADCQNSCKADQRAYYVGWGRRTLTIQKAPVHVMSNSSCDKALADLGDEELFRSTDQICARGCVDMCWFASGSSLSTYDTTARKFTLCGIGSDVVNQVLCTDLGPYDDEAGCGPKKTGATGATGPILGLGGTVLGLSDQPGRRVVAKAANTNNRKPRPVGSAGPLNATRLAGRAGVNGNVDRRRLEVISQPVQPATTSQSQFNEDTPIGIFSHICASLPWILSRDTLP